MFRFPGLLVLVTLSLAITTTNALAQGSVGAAYIVAAETSFPDEESTLSPPPESGLVPRGLVVIGGSAISRHVGIQAELSVSGWTSTTRLASYKFGFVTATTRHRDVLVNGLMRFGSQRACCAFVVGGGLVFARTHGTSTVASRDSGETSILVDQNPRAPRLVLTVGGDFPIPISRHLSILPTARLHWMSRDAFSPQAEPDRPVTGRPGEFAFRGGVGMRVDF